MTVEVESSTKSGLGHTTAVAEGVGQGPGFGVKSSAVTVLEDEEAAAADTIQVVGLESGPFSAAAAVDPADHSSQVEEAPAGSSYGAESGSLTVAELVGAELAASLT